MKDFTIEYQSKNVYESSVSEAIFEYIVLPCSDDSQYLIHHDSENSKNEQVFSYKNLFGFDVKRIRSEKRFKEFSFSMKALVKKRAPEYSFSKELSLHEQKNLLSNRDFLIEQHLFLYKTAFTTISLENEKYILKYNWQSQVFIFLKELNEYINSLISYEKEVTDVYTTADDVLRLRKGVCQDYAHLFIAMARYNQVPARYVSGYLNQGKNYLGSALMHAWVEALVPGVGWVGFDPSNNIVVNENYIKVSHGGDYKDCTPIKGVIKTNGTHNSTDYQVKVVSQ